MLTIYSKETTSFSSLGIGILKDFITSPIIVEKLNGAYTLEFKYAKNGYLSEYLVEQNIIKACGQPFRIWNIKKDMEGITILAKHIFFDLTYNFLNDVAPTNQTAQGAISWLLSHAQTATNFTCSGNCDDINSVRYVRKNLISAIYNEDNAVLTRFGGELELNVYSIYVHKKRGATANFSIRYKKNLTGIDFNLDFSNVATRIIPVGFDGLTIDNLYVTSSNESNYFTPLYKVAEFNNIKFNPDDVNAYQTEAAAKQALIDAATELFNQGADKPSISIEVNFVELSKCSEYENYSNLESVHLGDTIDVVIPELNITEQVRVVQTTYDCLLERFIELELGSSMPSIATSQLEVQQQVSEIQKSYINAAQDNAKSLLNHPFKGNIFIDETDGVIYLMDTKSPSTAVKVWKWSLGGLGYSSTGINGTYTTAITQDGKIVADFITTGQLNASIISGGTLALTSKNISISSTNFNVDAAGNLQCSNAEVAGKIIASDGDINGFKISTNQSDGTKYLMSSAYPEYDYTTEDWQKVLHYIDGTGTLTPEEIEKYDIDKDGVVTVNDLEDLTRIRQLNIDTTSGIYIQLFTNPTHLALNGLSVIAGIMTLLGVDPFNGVTINNGKVHGYRTLFDDSNGDNGTITLVDQIDTDLGIEFYISQYEFIEIFGTDNNGRKGVYTKLTGLADGDTFDLNTTESGTNNSYIKRTKYTIDDNKLVPSQGGQVRFTGNTVTSTLGTNYIKITKVLGYK